MHTNKTSSKNILSEFFLKPKTMMKDGQRSSGYLPLHCLFFWSFRTNHLTPGSVNHNQSVSQMKELSSMVTFEKHREREHNGLNGQLQEMLTFQMLAYWDGSRF